MNFSVISIGTDGPADKLAWTQVMTSTLITLMNQYKTKKSTAKKPKSHVHRKIGDHMGKADFRQFRQFVH